MNDECIVCGELPAAKPLLKHSNQVIEEWLSEYELISQPFVNCILCINCTHLVNDWDDAYGICLARIRDLKLRALGRKTVDVRHLGFLLKIGGIQFFTRFLFNHLRLNFHPLTHRNRKLMI
jgi:hypothetical protein